MTTNKSAFIVIEGSDGSGKGTQFKLLADWLASQGINVQTFDFPQYGQPSAYFVEKYLNGKYGTIDEIGPYKASLFYALDRYDAAANIRQALEDGAVVLCNRYVGSNMGHQGAKISIKTERQAYFKWNEQLEFDILGLPKPRLNIVLHMPAAIAQTLVDQKEARKYLLNGQRDLHENDLGYLERAAATYLEICQLFPERFTRIDCTENETVRPIDDIQNQIRTLVKPLIAVS